MAKLTRPSMPMPDRGTTIDVMAGPKHNFRPLAPSKNTPKALLQRPGNLRLGTRMG